MISLRETGSGWLAKFLTVAALAPTKSSLSNGFSLELFLWLSAHLRAVRYRGGGIILNIGAHLEAAASFDLLVER